MRKLLLILLPAMAAAPELSAQVGSLDTSAGPVVVKEVVSGLQHPWGMAFLPDGRLLITERQGNLRLLDTDDTLSPPLKGTPEVVAKGQGGLLDVALDPDFARNRLVYLSYAQPGKGGASTALGRGKLTESGIEDFEVIFSQQPKIDGPNHFGGRIVLKGDGTLFLTLGERFQFEPAQDLSNHLGAVVRLKHDGSIPADNPFVGKANAEDAIWSYGHRNIESAAMDPRTDQLWVAEMGPLGGDELNRPQPGKNYGWPVVSWGKHYDGGDIPDPPTHPEFADAVKHWTPVISPSGMVFYTGDAFPEWQGSTFIGGLSDQGVVRLTIEEMQVTAEERLPLKVRIRDVEQGPDGNLYLLTDQAEGDLLRLQPMDAAEN